MKKRALSLILSAVLLLSALPAAGAVSITDESVFLTQQTNVTCTLASTTMMLRRKAILDGDAGWDSITESSVRGYGWSSAGLLWNFSYRGLHVRTYHLDSNGIRGLEAKRAYLLDMLTEHPEGVVIYNHDRPHAILLTDYDSETDTFYCADPGKLALAARVPLSESTIRGTGQDAKLNNIHQIWYIASGVSDGAGTMEPPAEPEELLPVTLPTDEPIPADALPDLTGEALPASAGEDTVEDPAADTTNDTTTPPETGFADVPADAWFAEAVTWMTAQGITTGAGDGSTFSPDASCSVAEVLTFLWRASGQPEPTIDNPYTDVAETAFYYKPALWAYEAGLLSGDTLAADAPCTRSMVVTLLWKEAGAPFPTSHAPFHDIPADAAYISAVSWAVDADIAAGTGDGSTFSPDLTCSRAQIAVFLYRAFALRDAASA